MREAFEELMARYRVAAELAEAAAVLDWDQQCYVPPAGAEGRAEVAARLGRMAHEALTSPELGELLSRVEPWARGLDPESFEASCVRALRREYDRAVRVPADLAGELARQAAAGFAAWIEARQARDFRVFQPALERTLALTVEKADALGHGGERYDALLDLYEPDLGTAEVARIFARLRTALVPLVQAVSERADRIRHDFLASGFDEAEQWAFGLEVLRAIGFDFRRGRLDRSEHPFTTAFHPDDVRITTRLRDDFGTGLFGTIHEGGHALYEQGIPSAWRGTPVGTTASLGIHESQSRLWENVIGRSREFWEHFLPVARRHFPALGDVPLDDFYRAINAAAPSFIRVEADELTYNLHIFLRFDLERRLLSGDLPVGELPGAWREGMRSLLSVEPPDDLAGVLQDVHWSQGMIGYFPTYTLGNVASVQLWEKARADNPGLSDDVRRGEFGRILSWLRANVHAQGASFTGVELLRRATGRAYDPEPYLAYLDAKYRALYGL